MEKKSPKKLTKAFISEGQQVSKQSLRAAFYFPQSAVRTPASAISIKQSCLAFESSGLHPEVKVKVEILLFWRRKSFQHTK